MEHARVALFEDHRAYRRVLAMALSHSGHEVVLQADTLPEALRVITQSKPDSFDVAIVDGNLTSGGIGIRLNTNKATLSWVKICKASCAKLP